MIWQDYCGKQMEKENLIKQKDNYLSTIQQIDKEIKEINKKRLKLNKKKELLKRESFSYYQEIGAIERYLKVKDGN
jgi:peptidoglycan hydrolase CwlO-like protein